ncbi:MAG: epoxide hydrolase family protein [Dehalococcoidia bacterium]
MPATPFTIAVPDEALDDLRRRLAHTRWPGEIAGSGWTYGTNRDYLRELCDYWRDGYDWRAHEAALNRFPQFTAAVDGYRLHFVHARGAGPRPLPLVFSHGWPGSFVEASKIIGPLTDPAAHGGDAADAFDVVAPSLPGYGFSEIPAVAGYGQARTAELFDALMRSLGYDRYAAQGGDWGAVITGHLASRFPERVVGAHMNMLVGARRPGDEPPAPPSAEEWRAQEAARQRREEGTGYQRIQGTRPQTLAYGLTDSPAGLAGWIVEKWREWSDCGGDVERRFTKDELLTNISIYWHTGTINSSTRYYYESAHDPERNGIAGPVATPCAFAMFKPIPGARSRARAERDFNVVRWTEFDRGGHFAAMEEPELLVQDIREFFRPLR